ncbi:MAG TPA: TlyA family RNA methyltransferase, partial [Nitratifractor sp.]|nr:TlyA family RNA methyltransferase [Nitratifractor sp.]
MRLDSYLVEKGFFESRNRAALAIKEGQVSVAEKVVKKPSFSIEEGIEVSVQEVKFYVSRAAKKLEEYLKEYTLPIAGTRALDIGSSTGGFTQILLENGVESVDCVDVGREQLHKSLREEERVSVFEGVDIRDFQSVCSDGGGYDLIVSDVSFISLLKIIAAVDRLASIT